MPAEPAADPVDAVDFHFDIMCPWAYQASLWIRDVREQIGLDVRWRFFSLEEVNRAEGKKHPWERDWSYGWSMMRIGALLRRADPALLDRWYLAAATALHVDGRKPHRREVAEELLRELDLDPALAGQAIDDPGTTEEVRADHDRLARLGGWGVPDPGLRRRPGAVRPGADRAADGPGRRATVASDHRLAGVPAVVRGAATEEPAGPDRDRARPSGPYLEARDWVTIQKETP